MSKRHSYLTQIGERWYCSRAVPRPLQVRIGKKLWRVPAGSTLTEARRVLVTFLHDTDRWIAEAQLDPQAHLHGKPAEEIFHDPRFFGDPDQAIALSELPPLASTITSEQLVTLASNLKAPAPGTVREWQNSLKLLRQYTHTDFPLSVSPDDVRGFRDHLLKTYKTSTAQKVIRFLSGLHELAKDEGHVTNNPYKGCLKRVKAPQRPEKPQIPDNTYHLVQSLPQGNQCLFWLVAYTGLRVTEALGLRLIDINLKDGTISVVPHQLRRLKNESSRRLIPIDDRLYSLIENRCQQATGELLFPEHLSDTQRWTTPSFWQRRLGFGAHLLRHTFTTKLRTAGVNETVVAALLGHAAPSMTARYGSVGVDVMRDAVKTIKYP